jgi:hypothetical protein
MAAFLSSDASNTGIGGVCSIKEQNLTFHAALSPRDRLRSSTWRELKGCSYALNLFKRQLEGLTVKLYTDNQSAVSIVRNGSAKADLQEIAMQLFHTCLNFGIQLEPEWIPREQNVWADQLSRDIDYDDWSVHDSVFALACMRFGTPDIDRFADNFNRKTVRFNSKHFCPGTEQVDAFAASWSHDLNWLVPPIHLVHRTLKHLEYCRGRAILVIPEWPSASYWPECLLAMDKACIGKLRFPPGNCAFVRGSQSSSIFGPFFASPVLVLHLNFVTSYSI